MSDRTPVTTVEELESFDDAEMVEGYMDALNNEPEPGPNRSKAYWHGFRNGKTDRHENRVPIDNAQSTLAHNVIRRRAQPETPVRQSPKSFPTQENTKGDVNE